MGKYSKGQLLTVPLYSTKCELTPQAVYAKINRGEIEPIVLEEIEPEILLIDTKIYPPDKFKRTKGTNSKQLIAYVRETAEKLKQQKPETPKDFDNFLKERHEKVKQVVDYKLFVGMVKEIN